MNKIKTRKCVVCEKPYEYNTLKRRGGRGKNTITCSHKCSIIYSRIYYYIRGFQKRKRKNDF